LSAVAQNSSDLATTPEQWLAENIALSNRQIFRHALARFADVDARIVLLEADLAGNGDPFPARHGNRFFNVGICEATMIDMACAMAKLGYIVFAHTFAPFVMRACEQVRNGMAYGQANVKLVCDYGGVAGAFFGPTHHAIEDLAILRAMPGMTVLSPADALETVHATQAIASHDGPVYMRLGRNRVSRLQVPRVTFEIGRANCLKEGSDVGIIAHGEVGVAVALCTAQQLEDMGVSALVMNMHTLKPLDEAAVAETAHRTRLLVTVEEHNILGGLGGAICEVVCSLGLGRRVLRLGLQDRYDAYAGSHEYLLRGHGLDAEVAAQRIVALLPHPRPMAQATRNSI